MIPDLITNMISDGLYPLEKYGSVCLAVMENSTTPKTRGLVVRECRMCVEKVGLSAIGKKGIQTVAKCFSDETLTENKSQFLDLIESIITKMNGDTKKFLKICGPAYLSTKARDAIEKRISKKHSGEVLKSNKRQSRTSLSSRRSLAPPATGANHHRDMNDDVLSRNQDKKYYNQNGNVHQGIEETEGPFKFSFNASTHSKVTRSFQDVSTGTNTPTASTSTLSQELANKREANSGAAASLRQRLRQIRDRHQTGDEHSSSPIPATLQISNSREMSPTPPSQNTLLRSIMEDVDELLAENTPLGKNTEKSSVALVGLRKLHASLSSSSIDSTGTDPAILNQLKEEVSTKVSFCVFKLAR